MEQSSTTFAPRKPRTTGSWSGLLVVLLLVSGIAAAAPQPAGRVISVGGEVTAVRAGESARSLDRGDAVYAGDEIRTGRRGSVQVRFIDDGLVDLEPGTRFAVDRYRVEDDGSGGSVLMNFIRGALRTITGSIGAGPGQFYRMETPTATLGVRGTGYALQYCDSDCVGRVGVDSALGLHGRVDEGVVTVDTPQGNQAFGVGEFFFVPEGSAPRSVLTPPAGILDGGDGDGDDEPEGGNGVSQSAAGDDSVELESGIEAESSTTSGDTTAEVDSGIDTGSSEPVVDGGDLSGGGTTLVGGSAAATMSNGFADFGAGEVLQRDSSGNVVGASFGSREVQVGDDATLLEAGSDSTLGVGWGRWNGSFTVDGAPATGNLAFMVVNEFTDPGTLASLTDVNVSYSIPNPTGPSKNPGPSAFERNGNLWDLTALSFVVDFSTTTMELSNLNLTGPGSGLITLSTGDTTNYVLDLAGNSFDLDATNISNGHTATLAGKFVGAAAEGMVVSFDASDGTAEVTGVAVLAK